MRRLPAMVAILSLLLLGVVSLARSVTAQEATPVAGTHPLVGSWYFFDQLQPRKAEGQGLVTFAADGTVTATLRAEGHSTGHGSWVATGGRTAQANLVVFVTSEGSGDEIFTFHLTLTVKPDDETLAVETIFDNVMASGQIDPDVVPGLQWDGLRITADPGQIVGDPEA